MYNKSSGAIIVQTSGIVWCMCVQRTGTSKLVPETGQSDMALS